MLHLGHNAKQWGAAQPAHLSEHALPPSSEVQCVIRAQQVVAYGMNSREA